MLPASNCNVPCDHVYLVNYRINIKKKRSVVSVALL